MADNKHLVANFSPLILTKLWSRSRSCRSRSPGAHDFCTCRSLSQLAFLLLQQEWFVPPMSSFSTPHSTSVADHGPARVLSQACPSDEPGCSECSCTHLAVAVAGELRDEADVVFSDLHHLLTDVVLGADAALSACPPGQKSNGVRTQLPLRDPRDSCSLHFNALQACHPQGKCHLSGVWVPPEVVSHSVMGTLASPFSLNVSAPSTLKAALHVGSPTPRAEMDVSQAIMGQAFREG